MRRNFTTPAESLGSVSSRYGSMLRPGGNLDSAQSRNGAFLHVLAAETAEIGDHDSQGLPPANGSVSRSRSPVIRPDFDPADGFERDEKLARLEAVLFLAKEPLHSRKLSKFANLADGTEALTLVSRLNDLYDHSARAFRIENVAGGWQLRTRPQFGTWLRRLKHVPREIRLSAPAMETLAVVAYRQPVVRVDIEQVRGVGCGEILRQLMERDLVRVSGRSEELGRPYFYSTTNHFLQVFGLQDLEELPRAAYFRQSLEEQKERTETPGELATDGDETVTVALNDYAMNPGGDEEVRAGVAVQNDPKSSKKKRRRKKLRNSTDEDEWDDDDADEYDDDLDDDDLEDGDLEDGDDDDADDLDADDLDDGDLDADDLNDDDDDDYEFDDEEEDADDQNADEEDLEDEIGDDDDWVEVDNDDDTEEIDGDDADDDWDDDEDDEYEYADDEEED